MAWLAALHSLNYLKTYIDGDEVRIIYIDSFNQSFYNLPESYYNVISVNIPVLRVSRQEKPTLYSRASDLAAESVENCGLRENRYS